MPAKCAAMSRTLQQELGNLARRLERARRVVVLPPVRHDAPLAEVAVELELLERQRTDLLDELLLLLADKTSGAYLNPSGIFGAGAAPKRSSCSLTTRSPSDSPSAHVDRSMFFMFAAA